MREIIMMILCGYVAMSPAVAGDTKPPRAEVVLASMQKALKDMAAASFDFSFKVQDAKGQLRASEIGVFVAEGEAFRLSTEVLDVYCDGETKWIYDVQAEEISVFPHDTASQDPAENPFAVLKRLNPEDYAFRGKVTVSEADSLMLHSFTLISRDKEAQFTRLDICVDAATGLPYEVDYYSRTGDVYLLKIDYVSVIPSPGDDYFRPPQELLEDPAVYINDLR